MAKKQKNIINIGIVGLGANMINKHVPGFDKLEGVKIVGVCNRTIESSENVAKRFDIKETYKNWIDLVNDPKIDAIAIGTWPYMHHPITIATIKAGKHVLCEARMARNASEAFEMYKASKQNPQLVCQLVPSPFTLKVDKYIRKLILDDYLGEIFAVEIEDGGSFIEQALPLHWRQNIDLSGYNMMSLGILYESLMSWTGEAKRVMAMGKTFVNTRRDEETNVYKTVKIPDHIGIIADMECNAIANFQISRVAGLANAMKISMYGSKGTLSVDGNKIFGGNKGDEKMKEMLVPADCQEDWRVEEEFISAIRGREKITHTTFKTGFKYMLFTEAVYKSIETGNAIDLVEFEKKTKDN